MVCLLRKYPAFFILICLRSFHCFFFIFFFAPFIAQCWNPNPVNWPSIYWYDCRRGGERGFHRLGALSCQANPMVTVRMRRGFFFFFVCVIESSRVEQRGLTSLTLKMMTQTQKGWNALSESSSLSSGQRRRVTRGRRGDSCRCGA